MTSLEPSFPQECGITWSTMLLVGPTVQEAGQGCPAYGASLVSPRITTEFPLLRPQPLPAEMGASLITRIQVSLGSENTGVGWGCGSDWPVANPRRLETRAKRGLLAPQC